MDAILKEAFPGCQPYEINMFLYLQKSEQITNSKIFQIDTIVNGTDCWEDFKENNWVYTSEEGGYVEATKKNWEPKQNGKIARFIDYATPLIEKARYTRQDIIEMASKDLEAGPAKRTMETQLSRALTDSKLNRWGKILKIDEKTKIMNWKKKRSHLAKPKRGDIILVRTGRQKGRAIGIVQKNDYAESGLNANSRIHVLWINKSEEQLSGLTDMHGFNKAGPETRSAFATKESYKPSFDLINSLTENSPENDDDPQSKADTMKYPLNQILYGPPGTGKTWNTINHALAIIEDKPLDEMEKEGREEVKSRFNELKEDDRIAMVTFHQNFTYEDFIEGIRPVLADDESKDKDIEYKLHKGVFREIAKRADKNRTGQPDDPKYVLIIDEINRGNIAKIFAELITLIEPSKRIGSKKDETTVTLPYSQDSFGVPDNLYIIGTMNTADRSIALLDTALRRRFEFIEMMPDSKHDSISTDIEGVNCQELLAAMNDRIRFLLDREHQIGHTYFMDVDDMESLETTFKNKIIPLLQEYFYDNWEKIDLVLNKNGFIQKIDIPEDLRGSLVDDNREVYELLSFDREGWKKSESYQMIYEETGEGDNDGTE